MLALVSLDVLLVLAASSGNDVSDQSFPQTHPYARDARDLGYSIHDGDPNHSNYGGDAGKAEILMEYARQRNPINKVCFPKQKSELFGFRVSNDADILFSNLTL